MKTTAASPPSRQIVSFIAHTSATFFSTLAVQASTFLVLAAAGLCLPVAEFSRLSVVVATTMLSTALFDLGLNVTSTKRYGDTGDVGYLAVAFAARALLLPVAGVAGYILTQFGALELGLGVVLGGLLNVWNGVRSTDQAVENYHSLALTSIVFAVVRAGAGLWAATQLRDSVAVAIAIYAVPLAVSLLSASTRLAIGALTRQLPDLSGTGRYAAYVYLNALAFIAIPYVPQFLISARFGDVTTGTYGLLLTFSAPVALVVSSIYNVLLPKMLRSNSIYENFLWSWRGLIALFGLTLAVITFGFTLSLAVGQVYSQKFPDIQSVFFLYFSGFSVATIAGIYTLSIHTQGVPHINMYVNVCRLVILIALLFVFATDLLKAVQITIAVMLAGQIVMVSWLAARRFSR